MNSIYIYKFIPTLYYVSLSGKPHDSQIIITTVENNVMMALKQNSAPRKSNRIKSNLDQWHPKLFASCSIIRFFQF